MRPLVTALVVVCVIGAGCSGTGPIAPAPPIQFSATNLDGFTAVVRNAVPGPGAHLPYKLALPAEAHVPAAVFVSNPDALPAPRVIVQYPGKSPFGTFWLQADSAADMDQSFVESIAAHCISCSDHRLVDVAPGISGALLAGPYGPTSVTWLQNGLHFVVIGPQDTFSSQRAIALARATAAAQSAA